MNIYLNELRMTPTTVMFNMVNHCRNKMPDVIMPKKIKMNNLKLNYIPFYLFAGDFKGFIDVSSYSSTFTSNFMHGANMGFLPLLYTNCYTDFNEHEETYSISFHNIPVLATTEFNNVFYDIIVNTDFTAVTDMNGLIIKGEKAPVNVNYDFARSSFINLSLQNIERIVLSKGHYSCKDHTCNYQVDESFTKVVYMPVYSYEFKTSHGKILCITNGVNGTTTSFKLLK